MSLFDELGNRDCSYMVFCGRCPAIGVAAPGHAPAGWVWAGDTRVCGECWRRAVGKRQ